MAQPKTPSARKANINAAPDQGKKSTAEAEAKQPALSARAKKKTEAGPVAMTPEERRRVISELAYYRAEERGFEGGDALDDWLIAEAEVDRMLMDKQASI